VSSCPLRSSPCESGSLADDPSPGPRKHGATRPGSRKRRSRDGIRDRIADWIQDEIQDAKDDD